MKSFVVKIVLAVILTVFTHLNVSSTATIKASGKCFYQQDEAAADGNLRYIGEVKGKSYIKIQLIPVYLSLNYENSDSSILKYKGAYYESVSGRKYVLTGDFDAIERKWTFRCFNSNNQPVFIFSGKQKYDGSIEGNWRSKKKQFSFYLKPA